MLPLVPLAIALVPELIRLIAGDKAGMLAGQVAGVVRGVAGDDPTVAQTRIATDPKVEAQLRLQLAQLAIAAQKEQDTANASERSAELAKLRLSLADTKDSRSLLLGLTEKGSSIAWGAPVVSVIVGLGFFVVLGGLATDRLGVAKDAPNYEIVYTLAGAMATAFATMVSFWLGSSQGSRDKDATLRQLTVNQLQPPTGSLSQPSSGKIGPDPTTPLQINETLQAGNAAAKTSLTINSAPTLSEPQSSNPDTLAKPLFRSLLSGGFFSADPNDHSVPRSIRTNNPGALNITSWQRSRPGFAGVTEPDASAGHNVTTVYRTPEHGIGAWYYLLTRIYGFAEKRSFTPEELARRYAGRDSGPAIDGYLVGWARFASDTLERGTNIEMNNDAAIINLARALFGHEAGRKTPLLDEQIAYAIAQERAGTLPA